MRTTKYSSLFEKKNDAFHFYVKFITCITMGVFLICLGIWEVAKYYRIKNLHTEMTKCYVKQYSFCTTRCGRLSKCYNEQFNVTYKIFNGSHITSWIYAEDESKQSHNRHKGSVDTCWYQKTLVTSVIWKADYRLGPIIFSGIGILMIVIPMTAVIYSICKNK
ncbi:hypothetical protein I4U23_011799 [Adineta vaga]|nr:hypothetical protein I4U23_011799 [Adineta vaga]